MSHVETMETVAGCRIRVMRKGEGAPLLFLHGAGGAGAWLPFMDELAERYDVIVPEHPGFGGSETPEWLDNVGDLAYFYLDLIDHFGLDGVHLVGTSIGGWIAAEMATRSCASLKTLTLVAPAGIHVPGVKRGDMFTWSPEQLTSNLFHNQDIARTVPPPADEEALMVVLKNRLTTAKLGWSPRMHNPDLKKWLHRISVPTLIVWGTEDKLLPAEYGPAYRDLIPGAALEVFPECGHLPHVEKANEFTSKVVRFIEGAA
ncbi:alpha/beta fold hydrolase [Amorphus orientalis]|uniref:Pimeloyl-ACP methyl ester carboxylesterase n=1 Tax=Amorphus orientalis TaxID=649198 RepID=A0AAE3VM59_9HYPH|nr:alpha/beta hydrolase [Amorphus orientalis]MDQ0315039.1 pimeloyl-ACP methyl ester carboxylesterase [Amorphus orientalis]